MDGRGARPPRVVRPTNAVVGIASAAPREQVVDQLVDIGGRQPLGFGKAQVRSLPDALARTLAEHTGGQS
jgi:hypothetical protein